MLLCARCGAEVGENAKFCPKCGVPLTETETPTVKLRLAKWESRFVAWFVDIILVGLLPHLLLPSSSEYEFRLWPFESIPFFDFGFGSIIPFIYWTLVEGYSGRSIGKLVMDLKVTRLDGSKITFVQAALESFGKAFILPLDCIIGWVASSCSAKRQRLFNKLSDTIVVYMPKEEAEAKGVTYTKD
ncbi:MAG: RDD family protein [Candidatus Bathyarchaeia archaeon]